MANITVTDLTASDMLDMTKVRGGAPREESGKYFPDATEKWKYDDNGNPTGVNRGFIWPHSDNAGGMAATAAEMSVLGGTWGFSL